MLGYVNVISKRKFKTHTQKIQNPKQTNELPPTTNSNKEKRKTVVILPIKSNKALQLPCWPFGLSVSLSEKRPVVVFPYLYLLTLQS